MNHENEEVGIDYPRMRFPGGSSVSARARWRGGNPSRSGSALLLSCLRVPCLHGTLLDRRQITGEPVF